MKPVVNKRNPMNGNVPAPAPVFGENDIAVAAGGHLYIRLPLSDGVPSASGKTLVVASTRGNVETSLVVGGKPVVIGVNAYIRR